MSRKMGLSKRILDGYVLTENENIIEAGQYTEEKGDQIISNYGKNLFIVGAEKQGDYTTDDIVCNQTCLLPGFVKAHGHDHESPIIGIAKDCALTDWLDGAVADSDTNLEILLEHGYDNDRCRTIPLLVDLDKIYG